MATKKAVKKKTPAKAKKPPKKKSTKAAPRRKKDTWEAQYALDTLIRADEIKGDKKLMKQVGVEAKKREKALDNISNGK